MATEAMEKLDRHRKDKNHRHCGGLGSQKEGRVLNVSHTGCASPAVPHPWFIWIKGPALAGEGGGRAGHVGPMPYGMVGVGET